MGKYNKNDVVLGLVTGIENYGIFVSLDEYYTGLIHISEISDDFVRNVNNYVNIGETIKVRILEVDDDLFQLKLSIKNLDYRITRVKDDGIVETGSGFLILKENLDEWIKNHKKGWFKKKIKKNK